MSPGKARAAGERKAAAVRGKPRARAAGVVLRQAERPAGRERAETPFERFVLELLAARGGSAARLGPGDYQATFDAALARKLRRQGARLIFDPECAILPRGGVFVAPASRFGLTLLETARGAGHVTREWLEPAPKVDVDALAAGGFVVHDVRRRGWEKGELRWVAQIVFHVTMTLKGGGAEQDLRAVMADPRGPVFEFVEGEERRGWRVRPGFPDGPVWWGSHDLRRELPVDEALRLWSDLVAWINRVQEPRLDRWRRRCEESRDRDLARVNAYYQTRLAEEEERRRRRGEAQEEEDQATEAEIKLEWERRVRSVRARWEVQAELSLWGIEEIARPRVPVTWTLDTPKGVRTLAGEVDVAEGAVARLPCPACGRLVGEFWWEGAFVCRRCRGKGGRGRPARSGAPAAPAPARRGRA